MKQTKKIQPSWRSKGDAMREAATTHLPSIVFDNGGFEMKLGFSGEETPASVFRVSILNFLDSFSFSSDCSWKVKVQFWLCDW